ncbi:mersacidin/lichenicidin family type 2 lantibiotic [Nostoc sp. CMAA1605]|uniref:mersacidin/lichenicidin family type 2 lantibiotic n=1 Tax=Nostoc sp. CMAA1605 TaxID=2055159 RepID=UPI001F3BEB57|nr:mersacidin/lichenicidin family type 2 lantibiotic [Nostoc sp. CMAA1605]
MSDEQRSQLPENPAGMIELPNEVTQTLAGAELLTVFICKGTPGITKGILCTGRLLCSFASNTKVRLQLYEKKYSHNFLSVAKDGLSLFIIQFYTLETKYSKPSYQLKDEQNTINFRK